MLYTFYKNEYVKGTTQADCISLAASRDPRTVDWSALPPYDYTILRYK